MKKSFNLLFSATALLTVLLTSCGPFEKTVCMVVGTA